MITDNPLFILVILWAVGLIILHYVVRVVEYLFSLKERTVYIVYLLLFTIPAAYSVLFSINFDIWFLWFFIVPSSAIIYYWQNREKKEEMDSEAKYFEKGHYHILKYLNNEKNQELPNNLTLKSLKHNLIDFEIIRGHTDFEEMLNNLIRSNMITTVKENTETYYRITEKGKNHLKNQHFMSNLCTQCGKNNQEKAEFCQECGIKLNK